MKLFSASFLEKFIRVIRGVLPDFYTKEFPDDISETIKQLKHIHGGDDPMPEKVQVSKEGLKALDKEVKRLEASIEWSKFIRDESEKEINRLERYKPKIKNRKASDRNGLYYLNSLKPKDGDAISRIERDHVADLLEISWDFNFCGNRIFRVEEQLTQELFLTDIKHISTDFFELPYQTIGIHIPYNNKIKVRDELIHWIYVSEFDDTDGRFYKVMCVSEYEISSGIDFEFKEGDIFSQIKNQVFGRWESKSAVSDTMGVMKFLIALILYLNSKDADKKTVFAPAHIKNDKATTKYAVCSLGSGITIDRSLHLDYSENKEQHGGDFHILKWMVRGHFRNQAVGQGRSGRRVVWIRPFLKGKERGNDALNLRPNFYNVS